MATAKEGIKQKVRGWSHHDSADLYGIDDWGNGYFRISKKGEVTVRLNDEDGGKKDVSLCDLLEGLKERGTTVPVLFRFRDLLRSRIAELNDSFRKAIKEAGYQGKYQGVYPIKVNQQRQVVEEGTINALAGTSAVPWYIVGDKSTAKSVQVDYLNGVDTPSFRRSEKAGYLGFVWDIWLDWGITAVDFRGIAKNPGTTI